MTHANYKSDLSTDEKTLMAAVRTAEIFKRQVSSIFRTYHLSFPQYNILRVLEASTDGQSRITEVSRIMLVPGANMTGLAKRMEKSGFIFRKSDPKDERVTLLQITLQGKQALAGIEKEQTRYLKTLFQSFTQKEKLDLLEKFRRLIKNSRRLG